MQGLMRFRYILRWLFSIIVDQVNPGYYWYVGSPQMWHGWDWGWRNAYESHISSPWAMRLNLLSFYNDEDDDDFVDDDDFQPFED